MGQSRYEDQGESDLEIDLREPPLYKVYLKNDDYTPMDFVIEVLVEFFHKSREAATKIMLAVHHNGRGDCGIFPKEIALMKTKQVLQHAKRHDHPLVCEAEPHE